MSEDTLTIYNNNVARRAQKLQISTDKPQTIIDLPHTVSKSTLVALFDNLRIVPHEIKYNQLFLNIPTGIVIVEDENGKEHEGTLDSINSTEAVIRETGSEKILRIKNYRNVEFEKRFKSKT